MLRIGVTTVLLLHQPAVGGEHLPTAAMPAEHHHVLRAVKLDARRTLRPVRELVACADAAVDLVHRPGEMRVLEGQDKTGIIVLQDFHVRHLGIVALVLDAPTRCGHRGRGGGIAHHHQREVELVDTIIGQVAAGVVPKIVPASVENTAMIQSWSGRAKPGFPREPFGGLPLGPR